ncbi:hypothetical protein ACWEOE_40610 [Amycolatopsis sp. NPDC004368]
MAVAVTLAGIGIASGAAGPAAVSVPRAPKVLSADADDAPVELPSDVAVRMVSAPQGRLLARGSRLAVDTVVLPAPERLRPEAAAVGQVVRMTVFGHFPYRDEEPEVLIDGAPVGRGIVSKDFARMTVAVEDPARIHDGAAVSVEFGDSPASPIGALSEVAR